MHHHDSFLLLLDHVIELDISPGSRILLDMLARSMLLLIMLLAAALVGIVTIDHVHGCIIHCVEGAILAKIDFLAQLICLNEARFWRDILTLILLRNPPGFYSFHLHEASTSWFYFKTIKII